MSGADPRRALRRRRCNAATGVTLLHYRVDPPVTNVSVGEYGSIIVLNLVTKGIIDPTKIVRAAIQNAAPVAALLITTEAMIVELPKQDAGGPEYGMDGTGTFGIRSGRISGSPKSRPRQ